MVEKGEGARVFVPYSSRPWPEVVHRNTEFYLVLVQCTVFLSSEEQSEIRR
jgi:hypothetical protein